MKKYYTGYTAMKLTDRIRRHNSNHNGFTGKANDWTLVFCNSFPLKSDAIALERKINSRGAKRYMNKD